MKSIQQMRAKEALLTAEQVRKMFDYNPETGEFIRKVRMGSNMPGTRADRLKYTGYLVVVIGRKEYRAHRLAWLYYYGKWPDNENCYIDHINGNPTDNRITNLRLATSLSNSHNRKVHSNTSSGIMGVCKDKASGKWKAYISMDKYNTKTKRFKVKHLGLYSTFEGAVNARKEAEKKYGYTVRE